MHRWIFLGVALVCAGQDPIAPHSAFEPPAAKAAASLAASTKACAARPAHHRREIGLERDGALRGSGGDFAASRTRVAVRQGGRNRNDAGGPHDDRLVVSKDRAFTPEAAAKTGKAVIMIQSGIHAGEIEGKDTVLMLIRDMTVCEALRGMAGPRDLRGHPGVQRGRP